MHKTTPENILIVQGANPQTTNGGIDADYITMKNASTVRVEVDLTQAVADTTDITLYQATDVAGTGEKVLAMAVPIWANEATGTADTMVRQADDVSYTVANDAENKKICLFVNQSRLDVENDFDCLCVKLSNSLQATNFATVNYIMESQYQGETIESAIVD